MLLFTALDKPDSTLFYIQSVNKVNRKFFVAFSRKTNQADNETSGLEFVAELELVITILLGIMVAAVGHRMSF